MPSRSDSRDQRKPARWARHAARLGGKRPMTYEAMAHGARPVQVETAHMIRAALATGDLSLVAKLYAPIREALRAAAPGAGVTAEMEIRETTIDGGEDVRQMAYRVDPCQRTAKERLRAIDENLGVLIGVRMALCAQWGLR